MEKEEQHVLGVVDSCSKGVIGRQEQEFGSGQAFAGKIENELREVAGRQLHQ